jgi:hypothetical protein
MRSLKALGGTGEYKWKSDNLKIANINNKGEALGNQVGQTVI